MRSYFHTTLREVLQRDPQKKWEYGGTWFRADALLVLFDVESGVEDLDRPAIHERERGVFFFDEQGIPYGFPILSELPASGGMTDDERVRFAAIDEARHRHEARRAEAIEDAETILMNIILEERWVNENLSTVIAAAALVVANSNR